MHQYLDFTPHGTSLTAEQRTPALQLRMRQLKYDTPEQIGLDHCSWTEGISTQWKQVWDLNKDAQIMATGVDPGDLKSIRGESLSCSLRST